MSIIRRWIAPLVAGLGVAVLLLPGSAGARPAQAPSRPVTAGAVTVATVAAQQAATTVVAVVRIVYGQTSWGLGLRLCGRGDAYATGGVVVRSPSGAVRDPARIWPGDIATATCARSTAPVTTPTTVTPRGGWVRPVTGYTYGRGGCFGDPREWKWVNGKKVVTRWHQGADLSLGSGRPIVAAHAGTVVRAGWWSGGYGISVLISHGNGVYTHYAHMSADVVRVGQRVGTGQLIGRVGSTGHSSGPHLHYEVWSGWWHQINPRVFMARQGVTGIGC